VDAGWIAHRKHMIHGLVEVDVSEPRRKIREYKARTGETLSFTAFVLTCLGRAVDEDRSLHAYRNWRNQLVLFNEVDVIIAVETELEGARFPLVHIVRAVNQRDLRSIHREIRAIQAAPARSPGMGFVRFFPKLPGLVRKLLYRLAAKVPQLQKDHAGTVGLTSVGMFFGSRAGWGFGIPAHTLAVTLGGIAIKPRIVDGVLKEREYLSVTISVDHDLVDGAPAARFSRRFADLLEAGHGLALITSGGGRNTNEQ
jgi:pyruvate/2-oxoglutarate dehydrogenase complex dihydrolipoamide acyltransferase (E2) component